MLWATTATDPSATPRAPAHHARQGHSTPKWVSCLSMVMFTLKCVCVCVCHHDCGWVPTPNVCWCMVRDALAHAVCLRGEVCTGSAPTPATATRGLIPSPSTRSHGATLSTLRHGKTHLLTLCISQTLGGDLPRRHQRPLLASHAHDPSDDRPGGVSAGLRGQVRGTPGAILRRRRRPQGPVRREARHNDAQEKHFHGIPPIGRRAGGAPTHGATHRTGLPTFCIVQTILFIEREMENSMELENLSSTVFCCPLILFLLVYISDPCGCRQCTAPPPAASSFSLFLLPWRPPPPHLP